jgi:hypothetical protein
MQKTKSILISKTGDEVVSWIASCNKSWLLLNHASGILSSQEDSILITINSSALDFGNNEGEIVITPMIKNVASDPITIKVIVSYTTRIISGYVLRNNETWSGNILLKGDISIPTGFTLTINPGTKIFISTRGLLYDGGFDDNKIDFYVNGSLLIKGTAQNIVQFMSVETEPTNEDWWGIGLSTGANFEMTYCALSHSSYGIFIFSNMTNSALIKNCLFTNLKSSIVDFSNIEDTLTNNSFINVDYGYDLWGKSRKFHIKNSEFRDNRYLDISISGVSSNISDDTELSIENSNFIDNQWYNLYWSSNGYVTNSKIIANNCYGIQNFPIDENGNTIIINNELSTPIQNVGCGFSSTIRTITLKSTNSFNITDVQREFEKALELNSKNNAR